MKILLVVFVSILAVITAGLHFHFSAILPIFAILGFGLYWLTRDPPPQLPQDSASAWDGPGRGPYFRVYFRNKPDETCGGEDPKEGDGFR